MPRGNLNGAAVFGGIDRSLASSRLQSHRGYSPGLILATGAFSAGGDGGGNQG